MTDLLDLVRLGLGSFRLKVEDFLHAILEEDVMAASDALHKPQFLQEMPQAVEKNIRIRSTAKDLLECPARLRQFSSPELKRYGGSPFLVKPE